MKSLAVVLLSLLGCYATLPPENVPCSTEGRCPEGQVCDVDGRCRRNPLDEVTDPTSPDASVDPVQQAFTPSNGVPADWIIGVGAGFDGDAELVLHTDTGEVTRDGVAFRAAGVGLIDGIRFESSAGLGVFAVTHVNIGELGELQAIGTQPLVLLVARDVSIAGVLDVSAGDLCPDGSRAARCAGPGGGAGGSATLAAAGCRPGARGVDLGDTGGGGGGFGQVGANGGDEADDDPTNPFHMSKGGAGGAGGGCAGVTLEPLAGGSGGGTGGGPGGDGGGGGGAVQITAFGAIRISGTVVASGAGGGGGLNAASASAAGGGGGGSGGAILLEAVHIDLSGAIVAANGGGGGAGSTSAPGSEGLASLSPAPGGAGGGRAGGHGGARSLAPGVGARAVNDTGGGGGGTGRIRINAIELVTSGALLTPEPSVAVP